jgi:hypothetical protein
MGVERNARLREVPKLKNGKWFSFNMYTKPKDNYSK